MLALRELAISAINVHRDAFSAAYYAAQSEVRWAWGQIGTHERTPSAQNCAKVSAASDKHATPATGTNRRPAGAVFS